MNEKASSNTVKIVTMVSLYLMMLFAIVAAAAITGFR